MPLANEVSFEIQVGKTVSKISFWKFLQNFSRFVPGKSKKMMIGIGLIKVIANKVSKLKKSGNIKEFKSTSDTAFELVFWEPRDKPIWARIHSLPDM